MRQYLDFIKHILENGDRKEDRTGTGTISTFGYQMRFDLNEGFPLLTTKRVHLKSIIHELLWFISGDTNIKYLVDNDVKIWNDWPYAAYTKLPEYKGETMEEFVQKINNGALPEYEYKEPTGASHNPEFTVTVTALGKSATGVGPSKKAASLDAAENLLKILAI